MVHDKFRPPLRGHALTTFDGRFLSVDGPFEEIVGRTSARLKRLSIIDVTHGSDHESNHERLNRLRTTGESFEIFKRYVREDGKIVQVRNHVSVFRDGGSTPQLIASADMLAQDDADAERGHLGLAIALLANRSYRPSKGLAAGLSGVHWQIILSLYILEQTGFSTLFDAVCRSANVSSSAGYLVLLELMSRGWVDLDHRGSDLHDSSAILTAAGRSFLAQHLSGILTDVSDAVRRR